jgi:serine/threonine protein phosphatase PrpC
VSDTSPEPAHAHRTDVGKVRRANEDSVLAEPALGLWAVADGMGGHDNGQWASQTVVEHLRGVRLDGSLQTDTLRVADRIHAANAVINQRATESGRTMGSTIVALLLGEGRFAALWAGDSRIYLLRAGVLHRLTQDHSHVQDLVDQGLIAAEEAPGHPLSNLITRAVGIEATLDLDVVVDDTEAQDIFLLCSDGLTGVVRDAEIAERLGGQDPEGACATLLALTLARGAPDNVSIVVVAVPGEATIRVDAFKPAGDDMAPDGSWASGKA